MAEALLPAVLAGLAAALTVQGPSGARTRLPSVLGGGPVAGAGWRASVAPGRRLLRHDRLPRVLVQGGPPGLAVVVALAVGVGPVGALVLAVLAASATTAVGRGRATRAAERERGSALEACAALAGELRAGRSPAEALTVAAGVATGPLRAVLERAAGSGRFGADVPAALLEPAGPGPGGQATAVPEVLRALAACWHVCAETGGGLAAAVERLEEGLRAGEQARRAVESELAGPRSTAALLALLPVAGVALAAALGAQPLHVLLHTPAGAACLVAAVLLDLAGLAWTGRLARTARGG